MPCKFFPGGVLCSPHPTQPAMNWTDVIHAGGETHKAHIEIEPFSFVYTDCCHKDRWAARCIVIPGGGWYDPVYLCASGHGCDAEAF